MSFQLGEKRKWLAGYASHLHTQSTLLNTLIHKNTHTHVRARTHTQGA